MLAGLPVVKKEHPEQLKQTTEVASLILGPGLLAALSARNRTQANRRRSTCSANLLAPYPRNFTEPRFKPGMRYVPRDGNKMNGRGIGVVEKR
jgi:hypothetical protein